MMPPAFPVRAALLTVIFSDHLMPWSFRWTSCHTVNEAVPTMRPFFFTLTLMGMWEQSIVRFTAVVMGLGCLQYPAGSPARGVTALVVKPLAAKSDFANTGDAQTAPYFDLFRPPVSGHRVMAADI
jgi:hypothetical protein